MVWMSGWLPILSILNHRRYLLLSPPTDCSISNLKDIVMYILIMPNRRPNIHYIHYTHVLLESRMPKYNTIQQLNQESLTASQCCLARHSVLYTKILTHDLPMNAKLIFGIDSCVMFRHRFVHDTIAKALTIASIGSV